MALVTAGVRLVSIAETGGFTAFRQELRRMRLEFLGLEQLGALLNNLGRGMLNFAAIGARAFAGVAQSAAAFDDQMGQIVSNLDRGSTISIDRLSDSFLNLSQGLPTTAQQLSAIGVEAARAGVSSVEALEPLVRTISRLTSITEEFSESEATQALVKLNDVFGKNAQEDAEGYARAIDSVADALAALDIAGVATAAQIADVAQRSAGAGRQIGLTQEQLLAFAQAGIRTGVSAETVGTGISRFLTRIAADTDRVSSALGINRQELEALINDGSKGVEVIQLVLSHIQDDASGAARSTTEVARVMRDMGIPASRLNNIVSVLSQNMHLFDDALETVRTSTGEVDRRFGITSQTMGSRIATLRASIENLAVAFGQTLKPAVDLVVESMTTFNAFVLAIPTPIKVVIVFTGLLGVALTGLAASLVLMVGAIAAAAFSFSFLFKSLTAARTTFAEFGNAVRTVFRIRAGTAGLFSGDLVEINETWGRWPDRFADIARGGESSFSRLVGGLFGVRSATASVAREGDAAFGLVIRRLFGVESAAVAAAGGVAALNAQAQFMAGPGPGLVASQLAAEEVAIRAAARAQQQAIQDAGVAEIATRTAWQAEAAAAGAASAQARREQALQELRARAAAFQVQGTGGRPAVRGLPTVQTGRDVWDLGVIPEIVAPPNTGAARLRQISIANAGIVASAESAAERIRAIEFEAARVSAGFGALREASALAMDQRLAASAVAAEGTIAAARVSSQAVLAAQSRRAANQARTAAVAQALAAETTASSLGGVSAAAGRVRAAFANTITGFRTGTITAGSLITSFFTLQANIIKTLLSPRAMLSALSAGLGFLKDGFIAAFGAATGPIGLAIAAIVTLILFVVALKDDIKELFGHVRGLLTPFEVFFTRVQELMTKFFGEGVSAGSAFMSFVRTIGFGFVVILKLVGFWIDVAVSILTALAETLFDFLEPALSSIFRFADGIKFIGEELTRVGQRLGLVSEEGGFLSGVIAGIGAVAKVVFRVIFFLLTPLIWVFNFLLAVVAGVIEGVLRALEPVFVDLQLLGGEVTSLFRAMWAEISPIFTDIASMFGGVGEEFDAFGVIVQIVAFLTRAALQLIIFPLRLVIKGVQALFSVARLVWELFARPVLKKLAVGVKILAFWVKMVRLGFASMGDSVSNIANRIMNTFSDWGDGLQEYIDLLFTFIDEILFLPRVLKQSMDRILDEFSGRAPVSIPVRLAEAARRGGPEEAEREARSIVTEQTLRYVIFRGFQTALNNLLGLQSGGITQGTLVAQLHPGEVVAPLDRLPEILSARSARQSSGKGAVTSTGAVSITVPVTVMLDDVVIGQAVAHVREEEMRRAFESRGVRLAGIG